MINNADRGHQPRDQTAAIAMGHKGAGLMRLDRLLFLAALCLWLGAAARDRVDSWIDSTQLPALTVEAGVEVRDRNGVLLRAFTVADGRWRLAVSPGVVDPRYQKMLLAYEDKRFFEHNGVDWWAVLRAARDSVFARQITSGASTLTMQVARLLEEGSTGQWQGKLRQLRVALALERKLTKPEILSLYLHRAPFGGNVEGVRAASLSWFGKEPTRLTPAEAALLVALPQSPETRRPDRHVETARAARDRVLNRMVRGGIIDESTRISAKREALPTSRHPFPALAPHLADRLRAKQPDVSPLPTTLDVDIQKRMEILARNALRDRDEAMSIAIVVADHTTGQIIAHVGSADYDNGRRQGFVDMTSALRSPGSTLKPLVYALAFDAGLAHPDTLIDDVPTAFGTYAPQNFDGQFRGTIRMRDALQMSLNIPVVKLTEALGPAVVMAALRRAGVHGQVPGGRAGLAVSLGGIGVSLEGLVQLYAMLAQGGRQVNLHTQPSNSTPGPRVLSPEANWHIGDILSGLAPPQGAARLGIAYKTGTSYGYRDAWSFGWDGRHVIGVWMGRPDGTPVPGAFGGDVAAPILFQAFGRIAADTVPLPPPPPGTLMSTTADLPAPLQHFRGRDGTLAPDDNAPVIAFPPDGARMAKGQNDLVIKLREGHAPFTILADGRPVVRALQEREAWITALGPGFVTLSVIDGIGRSDTVQIRLD